MHDIFKKTLYGDIVFVVFFYILTFGLIGIYATTTQYRPYGDISALLDEEDIRCSSGYLYEDPGWNCIWTPWGQ
jgi:hypothetical protein